MIVRILGEGQFELDDSLVGELNQLDVAVESALGASNDEEFRRALVALSGFVREKGTAVDSTTILVSDLVLPEADASLEDVRHLLASEDV